MRFRFEKATQTDFNFDRTGFENSGAWIRNRIRLWSHQPSFLLVSAFAMGKSPPASPSRLIAARLLIAKSNARDKKAKKLSVAVKSPAGKAKANIGFIKKAIINNPN